ncbi:prepilin-type N-terminal cleavage/methylation domain-containing protein [Rhizobium sp. PP-CC-3A-592]|nr:prepilin-type N-terminal cleavage/methylation domain-containing protein [Rhizobium sp. PP-CC-3A-592]
MRKGGAQGGFTLIEVLVAFLVLAFGTLAIQQAVMTSVEGTRRAEDRLRAERVARSLMTAPISGDPGEGVQTGVMDGLSWSIRYEPLRLPFTTAADAEGKPVGWTPRRMRVTVPLPPRSSWSLSARRNAVVSIETIRLIRVSTAENARPEEGSP